tara:strand:- start:1184 stop:1843 length:660 start_codon:yes stop_codon:yes gene_type:complete
MAYVVPNAFSAGQTIESDKVIENIDALRNYINGSVAASDISTGSEWCEPKHVMKGLYNPIQNRYEMQSGISGGHPVFPIFHPGYFSSKFHDYGGSGRGIVPNMSVDFYLEADAKVFFYFTASVRPLAPLDTSTPTRTLMGLRIDGTAINTAQNYFAEQIEVNNSGAAEEPIVSPYRRRTWSFQTVQELSAGEHFFEITGQTGSSSVPIKFYTYSIQAFY